MQAHFAQNFSKVSWLSIVLCKMAVKLTFENFSPICKRCYLYDVCMSGVINMNESCRACVEQIQLFLDFRAKKFPKWPLNFFVSTIHQVIWPSPGTLTRATRACVWQIHSFARVCLPDIRAWLFRACVFAIHARKYEWVVSRGCSANMKESRHTCEYLLDMCDKYEWVLSRVCRANIHARHARVCVANTLFPNIHPPQIHTYICRVARVYGNYERVTSHVRILVRCVW